MRAGRIEYLLLIAAAFTAPVVAWLRGVAGAPILLPVLLVFAGLLLTRAVWVFEGAALAPYLGATARLLLGVSVLLSLGILLGVSG